jgi:Protein of unknown function (DUF2892)
MRMCVVSRSGVTLIAHCAPAPAISSFPKRELRMATSFFTTNEGTVDRALRIIAGLIGLSLIFIGPKTLLGLFGLIPLATGLAGNCPLYTLLGVNTCPKKT